MFEKYHLFIVEEDTSLLHHLRQIAEKCGNLEIQCMESGSAALAHIAQVRPYDIILTELVMSGVSGLEILRMAKEKHHNTLVVLITSFGTHEIAINAIKMGISGYIHKPFRPQEISLVLSNLTEKLFLTEQVHQMSERLAQLQHDLLDKDADLAKLQAQVEALTSQVQEKEKKQDRDILSAINRAAMEKAGGVHRYEVFADLSNLTRMYKDRIISDQEYQKIRQGILEKAYRVKLDPDVNGNAETLLFLKGD